MQLIDTINRRIGHLVAWLTLLMVINTLLVLIGRDVFGFGRIWLQELTTWMHATVFLLAAAYTLRRDEHVRVDVFYRGFSARGKAIVDLTGTIFLLLPFCVTLLVTSWSYVFGERGSWAVREASRQAGGLPFPATSLLKTFLILMPTLILLQGIAIAVRSAARLGKTKT
ncbi:MAG: TRAP transporter small permease subunit [Pseudomonadota bacterium]